MSNSMIERIAREIAMASAKADGKDAETAESFSEKVWKDFAPVARAVLKAMREPTSDMVDAAYSESEGHAQTAWSRMIDAALEKGA